MHSRRAAFRRSLALALLASASLAFSSASASADSPEGSAAGSADGSIDGSIDGSTDGSGATDYVPPPPPTFQGDKVSVEEKLGAMVPGNLKFRDHNGQVVTLGEVLRGDLPTILTFNYSDCPMLCSLQLNGLSAVLDEVATPTALDEAAAARPDLVQAGRKATFKLGGHFRVLTVVLEPAQALAKTQATRQSYLDRLSEKDRELAAKGWTFLSALDPSDSRAIAALADAVGFHYTYIRERAEWAHPAALIFLSSAGAVTRYVHGTQFEAPLIRESIVKAGLSEPATAIGFMNRCYHFDPDANNHSRAGVLTLRVGALAFLGLMILVFAGRRWLRRQPRDPGVIQE